MYADRPQRNRQSGLNKGFTLFVLPAFMLKVSLTQCQPLTSSHAGTGKCNKAVQFNESGHISH